MEACKIRSKKKIPNMVCADIMQIIENTHGYITLTYVEPHIFTLDTKSEVLNLNAKK